MSIATLTAASAKEACPGGIGDPFNSCTRSIRICCFFWAFEVETVSYVPYCIVVFYHYNEIPEAVNQ
jgi:hypothetical protein